MDEKVNPTSAGEEVVKLTGRKLVYAFFMLPYHVRWDILRDLGCLVDRGESQSDADFFRECVKRIRDAKMEEAFAQKVAEKTRPASPPPSAPSLLIASSPELAGMHTGITELESVDRRFAQLYRSALIPCYEVLTALHLAVEWELAPSVKAKIAEAAEMAEKALSTKQLPLESNSVAPPSARPAEPQCPICGHAFHVGTCQKPEGTVCHCFTSIQYEMDVEGSLKLPKPAAQKSSTLGEEKMTTRVACECGEELTPCTDKSTISIPCKGWVHLGSNSHLCLTAKGGGIAEPASAPDAGQPQIRSVQPVNLHNRHAVGESVVELTNAELYPSAPASAAREFVVAHLEKMFGGKVRDPRDATTSVEACVVAAEAFGEHVRLEIANDIERKGLDSAAHKRLRYHFRKLARNIRAKLPINSRQSIRWQDEHALKLKEAAKAGEDLEQRAQAAEAQRDKLHTELIHEREQHADEARRIDKAVKELERLRKEAK